MGLFETFGNNLGNAGHLAEALKASGKEQKELEGFVVQFTGQPTILILLGLNDELRIASCSTTLAALFGYIFEDHLGGNVADFSWQRHDVEAIVVAVRQIEDSAHLLAGWGIVVQDRCTRLANHLGAEEHLGCGVGIGDDASLINDEDR